MNPNHTTWWQYYQFESEPPLTAYPLTTEEELKYFIGRKDDIDFLESRTGGNQHIKVLITGTAGIGKTSLVCRYNDGKDNFIRFDCRRAGDQSLLMGYIVDELLVFASSVDGVDVSGLEEEYHKTISRTTGTEDQWGGGPIPASHSTTEQKTVTRQITPAKAREIGQQVIKRLHSKLGYLTYLFDETDHVPKVTKEIIYGLLECWSFPSPSIVVLTSRNEDAAEGWQNPDSIERQLFQFHRKLEPLWVPGAGNSKELLEVRFNGHYLKHGRWQFPLQDNTADLIDVLSEGNVREFLRYVMNVLILGAELNQKRPIGPSFAFNALHDEFRLLHLSDDDRVVLNYLRENPSSASDDRLLKQMKLSRTTIQDRFSNLEERHLIIMSIEKKKHIFTTTRKASLLLDYASDY